MGNHLADCLLTRDPERYGTIRPAQLWQSSLWRAEPWPDRDSPDFDGDLDSGRSTWKPSPAGSASAPSAARCWPGCSACWRTRRASGW